MSQISHKLGQPMAPYLEMHPYLGSVWTTNEMAPYLEMLLTSNERLMLVTN